MSFKWVDERAPLPEYHCEWLHNLPSSIQRRDCLFSDTFTNKGLIFLPSCTIWNLNILLHICLFICGNFSANFCVDFSVISFPPFFPWGFHFLFFFWCDRLQYNLKNWKILFTCMLQYTLPCHFLSVNGILNWCIVDLQYFIKFRCTT